MLLRYDDPTYAVTRVKAETAIESYIFELHAMNLKLLQLVLSNDDDNDDLKLGQLSCFKGGLSAFLVKTSSNPRPLWTTSK